ncbi:MAG TPA: DUF11 domain-containing protein, partial [Pyrinomonadaceae bacterium]|nr:DUF11 domain-containing protein [Pyrinomonadaceae bacterium]
GNTAEWTGGAMNCNSGAITCDISGSTFSGNNATGGYGGALAFFNGGVKTVTNSTVSGNTANQDGGGIVSHSGTLNLNFVTIAGNTCDNDNNGQGEGGGLQRVFATVNLKNSIIADNVDKGGQSHQIYGTITSQGYNHIEGTAGGTFTPTTGDITTGDPALTALAANGGPTSTRLPAYNSPVLDTIPLGTNGCASGAGAVTKDQRGATRATDGNADGVSGCDKGAAELGKLVGGIQAAAEPATYTFLSGANQVSLNVTNDGTNLDYLRVTDIAFNHPNATAPVQTGKYWIISGLRSDKTTQATADYTVNLTLPYATADSLDQVCRHSGGGVWDCAATSFAANASVTRTGVSQFSDWAVGDNEAPTDLEVTKKDSVDPVPLGSSFNYELRVYNRGPNVAEDVTVTDTIPAGLTVTGISMHATSDYTGAGCSFTGNTVTCSLGTMRVFDNTFDGAVKKGKALVYVNVTASQAGQYTNEANVSSGAPDPNSSNNAGRQTTTVLGLSSVEVTPGDVIGGANCQKATVRVTLTGIAPYDTYVEVSDDLAATTNIPASSSPAQLRIPAGQSSASLTINTVTVGAVQAGQVTASFGASASAPLTVRPNGVKWVQVSPSDIVGPGTVTATVNLECQPTEPLTVTLRSSKPFVARFVNPSNNTAANPVVVQMTTKQATFSVEAYAVDADTGINLSAQGADGVQRNVRLDVLKPTP